ncbi:hypothetical protein ACJ72_06998 [Emergomyces africanus]|uniref:Uncharacterized protein n=1 Tax=Emergomyces africanus TaxID=1955775 RepID=A0A1B7NPF9_9EURO|nr:hypothetical protein ACJ72_06998 [Emergomyces africanus]
MFLSVDDLSDESFIDSEIERVEVLMKRDLLDLSSAVDSSVMTLTCQISVFHVYVRQGGIYGMNLDCNIDMIQFKKIIMIIEKILLVLETD